MGILGWFRKKISDSPITTQPRLGPVEENSWLRIDEEISQDNAFSCAFAQVMKGVTVPAEITQTLEETIRDTLNCGGRKQQEAIFTCLHGATWKWPALIPWQQHFMEKGIWPYMWRGNTQEIMSREAILTRCPIGGVTSAELARVLDKKVFQILLANCSITFDPKEKVAGLRAITRDLSVEVIRVNLPMEEWDKAHSQIQTDLEWAMCGLLGHTVSMRHYKIIHKINHAKYAPYPTPLTHRIFETHCPVELEFAKQWKEGTLVGLPPFFPGDRTSFILKPSQILAPFS